MIPITSRIFLCPSCIQIQAVRSQGPGGQHVNKVASAVHLKCNIHESNLPDRYKERLLAMTDSRITSQGIIVIKAQEFRSQEKNKAQAMARLVSLIQSAGRVPKKRKPTRPTRASKQRRLESKTRAGKKKVLRRKIDY